FPETESGAMQREVAPYEGESITGFLRGHSGPQNQHGDSGSAARFFYAVRQDEPSAARTYEDNGATNFTMEPEALRLDDGSPARFFYYAKAGREERNIGCKNLVPQLAHNSTLRGAENKTLRGNVHPTVKPIDLMAYLCRLVTPP